MAADLSAWDLVVVFGIVNAIVFLHVGVPLRRLFAGSSDSVWRDRIEDSKNQYIIDGWTFYQKYRILVLGRLIHCHACTAFWVGWLYAFCNIGYTVEAIGPSNKFALASSAFCFAAWVVLKRLGADKL